MMTRIGIGLLSLTVFATLARADGGNAYGALRTARGVAGGLALAEMSGERGEPRPQEWTVIFTDPTARGGVKEVVVSGDVVVSQRTPLRGYAGIGSQPPITLGRLNVDSDTAFAIANKQARNNQVGFNWVDYTLRANNVTGAPMWVLKLYDYMGAKVGVIHVSAEDGTILMPLEVASQPQPEPSRNGIENAPGGQQIGGVIGTVGNAVNRTANTVKDATLRTVGTVQEVLTGERTIGPKEEND